MKSNSNRRPSYLPAIIRRGLVVSAIVGAGLTVSAMQSDKLPESDGSADWASRAVSAKSPNTGLLNTGSSASNSLEGRRFEARASLSGTSDSREQIVSSGIPVLSEVEAPVEAPVTVTFDPADAVDPNAVVAEGSGSPANVYSTDAMAQSFAKMLADGAAVTPSDENDFHGGAPNGAEDTVDQIEAMVRKHREQKFADYLSKVTQLPPSVADADSESDSASLPPSSEGNPYLQLKEQAAAVEEPIRRTDPASYLQTVHQLTAK